VSRKAFRTALAVVVGTFVLLAGFGLWAWHEVASYPERKHAGGGKEVAVEIKRGMKFPDVVVTLEQAKLIDRPSWFRFYAMHRGMANKVRAGKYALRDDMTPAELLDTLVKGVEEVEVSVTIPEGKHLLEVLQLIEQAGIASAAEMEAIARDAAWLAEQGIAGENADGYLFPETYRFKKPSPPKAVLEALVKQHRIQYESLKKEHARSLQRLQKQLNWGDREIVIMASIVEKETASPGERARVASVFYNRLLKPSFTSRRLETDPTIRYGCTIPSKKSAGCQGWDPADRLHRKQLDDAENPYNTYQHAGLPPGPISNPGRASLAAAMDPEDTEFFYFVAKDPRTHVFSKTFEEHTKWVNKYQK
jgi:UPF0755 protein